MNKLNSEKFLNEINKKWINKKCALCGHNNWMVDDTMVSPMTVGENGDIQLGGRIMPLIAVTCTNCGNVILVNPLVVGAIDVDATEK